MERLTIYEKRKLLQIAHLFLFELRKGNVHMKHKNIEIVRAKGQDGHLDFVDISVVLLL